MRAGARVSDLVAESGVNLELVAQLEEAGPWAGRLPPVNAAGNDKGDRNALA